MIITCLWLPKEKASRDPMKKSKFNIFPHLSFIKFQKIDAVPTNQGQTEKRALVHV
jgi:hypothetical protein